MNDFFISLNIKYGWRFFDKNNVQVWFKGYVTNKNIDSWLEKITNDYESICHNAESISNFLNQINGHFSLIVKGYKCSFASTDKIRSVPIFYLKDINKYIISSSANDLLYSSKEVRTIINKNAFLEIAMSGYTIGSKTLYEDIKQLQAGEFLLLKDEKVIIKTYYTFSPGKFIDRNFSQFKAEFSEMTLQSLKSIIDDSCGRQIVIPLSAGRDSRLILSGLKKLGAKDLISFTYGRINSFESKISKSVAEKLKIKWLHIPITIKNKNFFFHSDEYKKYIHDFDTLSSMPFVQDIAEIGYLKRNNLISHDSIIINGNGGDYISGGHINSVFTNDDNHNDKKLIPELWDSYLDKHYSLWGFLRDKKNDIQIINESNKLLLSKGLNLGDMSIPSMFHILEYLTRQSKYVVNMQMGYEYHGFEWRLPLWNDLYLNFWETVPVKNMVGQSYYARALLELNWGGVWDNIPVNNFNNSITPAWIVPIRNLFKIIFYLINREGWTQFERNALFYFMDDASNMALNPYLKILLDKRGFRNDFSWILEHYLETHNLDLNNLIH
jgi:asparagine synthase (glutamine-hydrolysing)